MTAQVVISGFVQGIGFRDFVKKHARSLELKGTVKNTSDGKVEAVFVGPKEKIDEMIILCKKGPMLSEVKDLRTQWSETDEEFSSFEILK
jgi:acylphosphatase